MPVRLIFTSLITTVGIGVLSVSNAMVSGAEWTALSSVVHVAIPGVLIATVLVMLRLPLQAKKPVLALAAVVLTLTVVAGVGVPYLPETAGTEVRTVIPENVLVRADHVFLSIGERTGYQLNAVVLGRLDEEPVMRAVSDARVSPDGSVLGTSQGPVELPESLFTPGTAVSPPRGIRRAVTLVAPFVAMIREHLADPTALAHWAWTVAFSLLIASLWVFARATRWLLINLLLAGTALTGVIYGLPFLGEPVIVNLISGVAPVWLIPWAQPVVMAIVAGFLFLIALLMEPVAAWKRELTGER